MSALKKPTPQISPAHCVTCGQLKGSKHCECPGAVEPLRMDAYYFGFEETGARSIDRILSAVACAGKAYHQTEDWRSECEPYHPEMRGPTCVDWIQNAAADAATEREALLTALMDAVAAGHNGDEPDWDAMDAAIDKARGDKR